MLVVNDTHLYYEEAGVGPAVVLIHGFTLDTRMWDDQFLPLAQGFRVIRYDLRGFGCSVIPTDAPYSHVENLRALLDELGIRQAHLVGLSKGGGVALDFALTYPQRALSLALIDTVLGGHVWSAEGSARDVDPSPQGFPLALASQAGGGECWLRLERLVTLPLDVLFLDTYERLAPLDNWLRETFLLTLPAHVLVIIASRNPPAEPWRTDPDWPGLHRLHAQSTPRRKLPAAEDPGRTTAAAGSRPGHCLQPTPGPGLSSRLAGAGRDKGRSDQPGTRSGRDPPDGGTFPARRAHRPSLPCPGSLRPDPGDHAKHCWPMCWARKSRPASSPGCTVCPSLKSPKGIFPHDLVRDVIESDLHRRNPRAWRGLYRKVQQHLNRRFWNSSGLTRQQDFSDLIFLQRHHPDMKPCYDWRTLGFAANLLLETVTSEDEQDDLAVRAIWAYVRRYEPLRPGERIQIARF